VPESSTQSLNFTLMGAGSSSGRLGTARALTLRPKRDASPLRLL